MPTLKPGDIWQELSGQSQQYLIEIGLVWPRGKRMMERRRGKDDRRALWEKGLVTYYHNGSTLTLTDLGRDVLLSVSIPVGFLGLPSRTDLLKVQQVLAQNC